MHDSLGFSWVCFAAPNSLATGAAKGESLAFLERSVQTAGEKGFLGRERGRTLPRTRKSRKRVSSLVGQVCGAW